MAEVVKLLKPDSGGHMARIFSAYAWRAEGLEILGMPSLPALVRDITQHCSSAPPALSEDDLFLVRGDFRLATPPAQGTPHLSQTQSAFFLAAARPGCSVPAPLRRLCSHTRARAALHPLAPPPASTGPM